MAKMDRTWRSDPIVYAVLLMITVFKFRKTAALLLEHWFGQDLGDSF